MGRGADRGSGRRADRGAVHRRRNQKVQGAACGTQNRCHREGECRMGQTSDEIVSDIAQTREDLKSNLQELETRVKAAADWRSQFRKRPGVMLVAALVGGALLAATLGKRPPTQEL